MREDSRIEIAWKQLELENPDSTERLKSLRAKEEQKQVMRQGGELEKEKDGDQEQSHLIKEDHKQRELQNNNHLKQLFSTIEVAILHAKFW